VQYYLEAFDKATKNLVIGIKEVRREMEKA